MFYGRSSSRAFFLPPSPLIGDRFVHIIYFVFVSEIVVRVFSTPVISSVRIINLLFFCLGRRRPLCMFLPISLLEGRFIHIIFYGSYLLYRSSSPRMYFSTPVTSNWGWFYSYVFYRNHICFIGGRRLGCFFLPLSPLIGDRFVHIIYFVFVSEVVARGVFFYPSQYSRIVLFILDISGSYLLYRRSSTRM